MFIQTIHDSLVYDCVDEEVGQVATILKQSIEAVPALALKYFGHKFTLPMTCEMMVGPNKNNMEVLDL